MKKLIAVTPAVTMVLTVAELAFAAPKGIGFNWAHHNRNSSAKRRIGAAEAATTIQTATRPS